MIRIRSVVALIPFWSPAAHRSGNPKVPAGAKSSGGKHATIETDKGSIEIEFFESDAPKAVENFRLLAEHDYYDGVTCHRIVKGFMIQCGDPTGTGAGGESAWGDRSRTKSTGSPPSTRTATAAASSRWPTRDRTPTAASLHHAHGLRPAAGLRDLRESDFRHVDRRRDCRDPDDNRRQR
jgi:hypothetical protein